MNYKRSYLVSLAMLFAVQVIVAANSFRLQREATETRSLNRTFLQSDTLDISDVDAIMGLSVSGQVVKSSPEYLVRIVLTDKEGHEHLVMEFYEEICSDSIFSISDYCEETALLDGITPRKLIVYLKDATLRLDRMSLSSSNKRNLSSREIKAMREELKHSQSQSIIDKINAYNRSHNRLWLAGETPLSKLDYAAKKQILGIKDCVSSGGIEYYTEGVFELKHTYLPQRESSTYIDKFDWRTRHGKSLMTSIKTQTGNTCSVFATNGCVEALVNLYYNKNLDLDLSEMELMSCADSIPHNYQERHPLNKALFYVVNHGVCDEESYPFEMTLSPICKSEIIIPTECVRLNNFHFSNNEKRDLIKSGPLVVTVKGGVFQDGHAMVLCGYSTIHENDTLYRVYNINTSDYISCVVEPNDPRIGMTYWILKNSAGDTYYSSQGGYMYLLETGDVFQFSYKFSLPLMAQGHTDREIIWEDRDGDGYFNWGISASKPSTVPSWVPSEKDGDDTDPIKGKMDDYGYCEDITIGIDTMNCGTDGYAYGDLQRHVKIRNGATYSFYGDIMCQRGATITVEANSTLVIEENCRLRNAVINLKPQSHLIVRNGGEIYLRKSHSLEIPLGATCEIPNGAIYNRPY